MAEKKKENKEEVAEGAQAKPKSKKMLFIILGVVLLLGGGGGAFFLLGGSSSKEESAEEEEAPREIKQIHLDPFIVNLSEAKSFLKIKLIIEYDAAVLAKMMHHEEGGGHGGGGGGGSKAPPPGALPPELTEKEPRIRDTVIRILSSKTVAEVLTPSGKQQIEDEILEGLNEALEFSEPVFVNLYFAEFIIQ